MYSIQVNLQIHVCNIICLIDVIESDEEKKKKGTKFIIPEEFHLEMKRSIFNIIKCLC